MASVKSRADMARALVERIEAVGVKTGVIRIYDSWDEAVRFNLYRQVISESIAVPWLLFGNRCAAIKALFPDLPDWAGEWPRWVQLGVVLMHAEDLLVEAARLAGIDTEGA